MTSSDQPVPYTLTHQADATLDDEKLDIVSGDPGEGAADYAAEANARILEDHPFAPYITYKPTAHDLGLTDDPEHEPEAE